MEIVKRTAEMEQLDGVDEFDETQPERHDYDPERRLWTAVLLQAVLDWRSNNMRARRDAETFLFKSPDDLEGACHRAGLNPSVFQSKLRRLQGAKPLTGVPRLVLAA
jgi:hypothetical protein